MQESFDWVKPSPFWSKNGLDLDQGRFFRPVILEYASDDFLEDFLGEAAAASPGVLEQRVLAMSAGAIAKLYQPAHGRFYLVCATLCCRQPGLPDRAIRSAEGESAFYVLRRVQGSQEYAWVVEGDTALWRAVGSPLRQVGTNEERLPMFRAPAGNAHDLLYAYLPATSRSATQGNLADVPEDIRGDIPAGDLRVFELENRFLGPLASDVIGDANQISATEARRLSVYLLLDLWDYFDTYLPSLAAHLDGNTTPDLAPEEQALFDFLSTPAALDGEPDLIELLTNVVQERDTLNNLGDDSLPSTFEPPDEGDPYNLSGRTADLDEWAVTVQAALAAVDEILDRDPPQAVLPRINPGAGEQFVVRCVYERPQCDPVQIVVSHPTVPFELAGLYDPDAPARQINIALPTDMSLSALRRFQKGANFVLSRALRDKLNDLPGMNLGGDDVNAGSIGLSYICSFSIPIITICAFILLLVLVLVLNIVFWWLPFFKICLPVPKSGE